MKVQRIANPFINPQKSDEYGIYESLKLTLKGL